MNPDPYGDFGDDFYDDYSGEDYSYDDYLIEEYYPNFLTNFSKRDLLLYKTAIYEYKRYHKGPGKIWIEDFEVRLDDKGTGFSLHRTRADCTLFWRIFESVEKDLCISYPYLNFLI